MEKQQKLIQNGQLYYGCLHFRYNHKKYLYGLSEELLTFGESSGLLSKFNGNYEPTQRQRKEKSSLLLKKEKAIMKIDYIIIPQSVGFQYLWHFQQLAEKLSCRRILILREKMGNDGNRSENYLDQSQTKQFIAGMLAQSISKERSSEQYRVQTFREHQNVLIRGTDSTIRTRNQSYVDFEFDQPLEIFQQDMNKLTLQILRKDTLQYGAKSMFKHINPLNLMEKMTQLLNEIRHDSNHKAELRLSLQQIRERKIMLEDLIIKASSSEEVFYPTHSQESRVLFLPQTSMLVFLHKHVIALVNPSNLASYRLSCLNFPISQVKYLILTRFSLSFLEFLLAWGAVGQQSHSNSFLQIITLDWIYEKVKLKLKQCLLWDDQMIRSKIAFRVIQSCKTNQSTQNHHINPRQHFYPCGFLKIYYSRDQLAQDRWVLRFGDREILFLNQLSVWKEEWLKRYEYVIFDEIKQNVKKSLYEKSNLQKQISNKCVYNRSSSAKYRHRYFYGMDENQPMIRLQSQIRMGDTFVPYFMSGMQKERYQKVKLLPGESVNCLDRNVLLVEGLVAVLNQYTVQQNKRDKDKNKHNQIKETRLWLCWPVDTVVNGRFSNLDGNKIRRVKELIAIKESIVLLEEVEDEHFYSNHQVMDKDSSQLMVSNVNKVGPFLTQNNGSIRSQQSDQNNRQLTSSHSIKLSQLQVADIANNSLIAKLSKRSSNFKDSYRSLNRTSEISPDKNVEYQSPLYEFSRLLKRVTLESGQTINADNSKVYFVIKGTLKWKSYQQNEPSANNQSFIGNMRQFYQNRIEQQNVRKYQKSQNRIKNKIEQSELSPIEVVKDTWALEGDVGVLYGQFFSRYPEVGYWVLSKGRIFY